MQLSYDEIRRIHRDEKNSSRLVELPSTFYSELNDFIKQEKKAYVSSLKDFSITKARNFTNLKKMIEEIFSTREKKILSRALIASRTGELSARNVASQEDKFFEALLSTIKKHNTILDELFSDSELKESAPKKSELSTIKVSIKQEIPSFVGADMKNYGPYSKSENVELPYKIAKLLISRTFAEEVSS